MSFGVYWGRELQASWHHGVSWVPLRFGLVYAFNRTSLYCLKMMGFGFLNGLEAYVYSTYFFGGVLVPVVYLVQLSGRRTRLLVGFIFGVRVGLEIG